MVSRKSQPPTVSPFTALPAAEWQHGLVWIRGLAAYDGSHIVLDGADAELYRLGTASVVYDLASVRHPADALGFVRKHGPLLAAHDPGWEGLDDDEKRASLPDYVFREPFSEWIRAARQLENMLKLGAALRRGRAGDATAAYWIRRNFLGDLEAWTGPQPTPTLILRGASEFLATFIQFRIEATEGAYMLSPRPDLGVGVAPAASTLEGYAWLQVGLELAADLPMAACRGCGRVFPQTHRSQKYCAPQCAGRTRSNRFKYRHRAPADPDPSS